MVEDIHGAIAKQSSELRIGGSVCTSTVILLRGIVHDIAVPVVQRIGLMVGAPLIDLVFLPPQLFFFLDFLFNLENNRLLSGCLD